MTKRWNLLTKTDVIIYTPMHVLRIAKAKVIICYTILANEEKIADTAHFILM